MSGNSKMRCFLELVGGNYWFVRLVLGLTQSLNGYSVVELQNCFQCRRGTHRSHHTPAWWPCLPQPKIVFNTTQNALCAFHLFHNGRHFSPTCTTNRPQHLIQPSHGSNRKGPPFTQATTSDATRGRTKRISPTRLTTKTKTPLHYMTFATLSQCLQASTLYAL